MYKNALTIRSDHESEIYSMPKSPHTKRQKSILKKLDRSILMIAYVDGRGEEWRRLRSVRRELADSFARCNLRRRTN